MMKTLTPFVTGALLLALAPRAWSRPERVTQIPAAPDGCDTCHLAGGGSDLNVFGLEIERTLNAGMVDWPTVCPLDADGDGVSNGEELGDADCSWQLGDPVRTAVSNPADAGAGVIAGDDEGGCRSASASDAGPLVLVLMGWGAALLARRRQDA